jgi:hypothetical protein
MHRKLLGIIVDTDTTDHIFCISQILEKKWEYSEVVHQLFIASKKPMIQLGCRSCIIFLLSFVPTRTSEAKQMCLNET